MARPDWTESFFDHKRLRGDEVADGVVEEIYREHGVDRTNRLLRSLVADDRPAPAGLPPRAAAYFARPPEVPRFEERHIRVAQETFSELGPEILMILGTYSLPGAYAARKGAQVLYRTGRLLGSHALRRLFETTQMVVDVLSEGGLGPHGAGARTVQKVRLMHAAIRYGLRHAPEPRWDEAILGVPVNQEDLAGTFTTFSVIVLRGLRRLGAGLGAAEEEAYLHAWIVIARMLGLDEDLIPRDLAEAEALTDIIRRRQIAPSPEGRALAASLVEALDGALPRALRGFSASAMHFFLDADRLPGEAPVTATLGVPDANWTLALVRAVSALTRFESRIVHRSRVGAWLLRLLTRGFVRAMLAFERGGARPAFPLPSLGASWLGRRARAAPP